MHGIDAVVLLEDVVELAARLDRRTAHVVGHALRGLTLVGLLRLEANHARKQGAVHRADAVVDDHDVDQVDKRGRELLCPLLGILVDDQHPRVHYLRCFLSPWGGGVRLGGCPEPDP